MLAQFDHPALIKVFRFWEANGTAYMVMPFLSGKTLQDVLKARSEPPGEAWIRGLLSPLMEALAVLHEDKVYHRDIAPDNIMLLAGDRPVLLDFGAARKVISDMTHALTVILKPGYAPIEQYADMPGMKQGPWTDVYALAAVVYFMILGKQAAALGEPADGGQLRAADAERGGRPLQRRAAAGHRPLPRGARREPAAEHGGDARSDHRRRGPGRGRRHAGGARPAARHRGAAAGAAQPASSSTPTLAPTRPRPRPRPRARLRNGPLYVRADDDRGPAAAAPPRRRRRARRPSSASRRPNTARASRPPARLAAGSPCSSASVRWRCWRWRPSPGTPADRRRRSRCRSRSRRRPRRLRHRPWSARAASAAARAAHRQRRRRHRRGGRRRRPGLAGDAGSARRRAPGRRDQARGAQQVGRHAQRLRLGSAPPTGSIASPRTRGRAATRSRPTPAPR